MKDSPVKDYLYYVLATKNKDISAEYDRFVNENIEEHYQNHMKHIRVLLGLNWHYRVLKKTDGYIYEKQLCLPVREEFDDIEIKLNSADYDLIKNSSYFNADWYLQKYPDVKGMDPVEHYLNIGWKEFRSPGPSFSTLLYLNRYDDVRISNENPLLHYEKIGKKEKRISSYKGLLNTIAKSIKRIENSVFWDNSWYRNTYMNNQFYIESAAVHYFCIGTYLGMNPSKAFSHKVYETIHPEVKEKPYPYLLHYEDIGKNTKTGYFHQEGTYYSNTSLQLDIARDINEVCFDMFGKTGKRVLLISHLMNLTGAPKVLANLAIILKQSGYYPVVATLKHGELEKTLENYDIPTVILTEYEDEILSKQIVEFAGMFDVIFFNTVEALKLAHILKDTSSYKICWLHEGNMTLENISENQIRRVCFMDKVYTCASYCNKFFDKYIDKNKIEVLHYGVDERDIRTGIEKITNRDKFVISIVGTIGYRKGHDILFESLNYLPKDILDNIEIRVIGFVIDEAVGEMMKQKMQEFSCINFVGKVSNEEAVRLINESSLLVVPSRDDPMPVVITEAMILKRPVLISKTVGTTDIVSNGVNAFIIDQNTPEGLAAEIEKCYNLKSKIEKVGTKGYRVYKKNLSDDIFRKNILNIFGNCDRKTVSEKTGFDNSVQLVDAEKRKNGLTLIFECNINNELAIFSDEKFIFEDKNTSKLRWKSLNKYLSKENKRIAFITISDEDLVGFNGVLISRYFDGIRLSYGENVWSNLKNISDKHDIVLVLRKNVIDIYKKSSLHNRLVSSPLISNEVKGLYKKISEIKEQEYNIYVETRENKNDNAYQLFLRDLERTGKAYFVAPQSVIDSEKDEYLKAHYLKINSPESKDFIIKAKHIVCSWYQLKPYGEDKMKYLYPFMKYDYIFVPHGISFDKDSFYLNKSSWGTFAKTIVASSYEADYFEKYNGYKGLAVLGYPRLDKWINEEIDDDLVILNPTWRKNISDDYIKCLVDIAKTIKDKKIVYIAHPSIEDSDYRKITAELKNINNSIVCKHSKDSDSFNYYFKKAKYLITDYSSVAYDFSYKKGIAIYYKPLMDVDPCYNLFDVFYESACGIIADNVDEVSKIVGEELPESLKTRINKFFKYTDNNNTDRVLDSFN